MGVLIAHNDDIFKNSLAKLVREFFLVCGLLITFGSLAVGQTTDLPEGEVGAKIGVASGISVLKYTKYSNAVEAIAMTNWDGFILAGLYHVNFDITAQLNPKQGLAIAYIAFGGHYSYFSPESVLYEGEGVGPDLGVGLTYLFDNIPFSLSLDNRFFLDFPLRQRGGSLLADLSLNIRYVF